MIAGSGLLLRVLMSFFLGLPHEHTDTFMYLDQAKAILNGTYVNYAPNGYPFIIAFFQKFLFFIPLDFSLSVFNILLGTATILYVYGIGKIVFNNTSIALIAAAIITVYPNQLNYSRWLLTEIPCTFFALASFYYYLKNKPFWSGILLGITSLIRTTFLPVSALLILYHFGKHKKIQFKFIGGLLIPLLLLATYCYQKTGKFSISGNAAVNLVYSVYSFGGNIAWEAPKEHPEIQTEKQAKTLYLHEMTANPGYFIKQRLASLWELWGFFPSGMNGTRGIGSRLLIGFCNLFLLLFSFTAIIKNYKNDKMIILLFPVIVLSTIHALTVALARYTVPMEPFLIIPTAWSIWSLLKKYYPIKEKTLPGEHADIPL